jgi:hypothetical protein
LKPFLHDPHRVSTVIEIAEATRERLLDPLRRALDELWLYRLERYVLQRELRQTVRDGMGQ